MPDTTDAEAPLPDDSGDEKRRIVEEQYAQHINDVHGEVPRPINWRSLPPDDLEHELLELNAWVAAAEFTDDPVGFADQVAPLFGAADGEELLSSPMTLIGKPDCHLCDVASDVIDAVVAELPDAAAEQIEIVEASIQDDPALYELWWEKIPVILIDGRLHAHWRVSPDRLRAALVEAVQPSRR